MGKGGGKGEGRNGAFVFTVEGEEDVWTGWGGGVSRAFACGGGIGGGGVYGGICSRLHG